MFNVGYDALASFFIDKALFPYYNVAAVECKCKCKCNRIANLRIKNWAFGSNPILLPMLM